MPSNVWPSSLPEFKPCDYCIWGDAEKVSNARSYNSVASLKTSARRAFRIKKKRMLPRSRAFRAHIQQIEDT